ncbi:MAG: penicillin-binding protein, partial [Actinomycetota bacterium]|nr:penicillin-binding protein [Actinomycetota bacterium]
MRDADRSDITVAPGPAPARRPRLKKLRLALILVGLSLLALVSTAFGMMMAVASDLPQLENRPDFNRAQNSILTDVNGTYLATLTDQGRIIVGADDIALTMQHAIIAVEDRRFYENDGVDLRGIGRAIWQDVVRGGAVQGGSTITQQFVKNATRSQNERTVVAKLREAALAYHLTRKWSKEKILTQYLNSIYFGNGAYGVESAARTYFGDDVNHLGCGGPGRRCASELKPQEAALLAGIVSSPSAYDPIAHPRTARRRRDLVLRRMHEQGYLTAAEYARSAAEPIPAAKTIHPPQVQSAPRSAAYFTTWVQQQLIDRYGPRRALERGLRVQTTLDLSLQRAAENAIRAWLPGPQGPSAALVAIDNRSGEVRAMIGGRDYAKAPFNLATQGQRQPGSAFKPFVLATALRQGISPLSTWVSRKQVIQVPRSSEKFVVRNYEGNYSGVSTLARATTFSDNSVYAQVGIRTGPRRIARTAERMGIRTPVSHNYAMTLGGLKQGVTPLDMAHAYETLATGGELVTGTLGAVGRGPVGIRRVTRRGRRDVLVDRNEIRRRRVLSRPLADTTTGILESVVKVGTARAADLGDVRAWGKTGTTENYGDAWFVGATDRLTVAVWVGYADRLKSMKTEFRGEPVAGGTYPTEIWHTFMLAAVQADRQRLQRRCSREREQHPDARPSRRCIDAGLAPDPTGTSAEPTGADGAGDGAGGEAQGAAENAPATAPG